MARGTRPVRSAQLRRHRRVIIDIVLTLGALVVFCVLVYINHGWDTLAIAGPFAAAAALQTIGAQIITPERSYHPAYKAEKALFSAAFAFIAAAYLTDIAHFFWVRVIYLGTLVGASALAIHHIVRRNRVPVYHQIKTICGPVMLTRDQANEVLSVAAGVIRHNRTDEIRVSDLASEEEVREALELPPRSTWLENLAQQQATRRDELARRSQEQEE